MKEFKGKVAVITGAASGIGRAMAERCLEEGMKVVLADIEAEFLRQTQNEFARIGSEVLAVATDVSVSSEVEKLARKTVDAFGQVNLLVNNAGIGAGSSLWESSINDCKWVIGVNLWGVIHGIRSFVPIMLDQNTTGHIVNTSSLAGLTNYHPSALYHLTKHGVVALSEQLYHDLAMRGAKINVSVLCPGFVNTNIMDGERYRPQQYRNDSAGNRQDSAADPVENMFREMVRAGMSPAAVADQVFNAIIDEKFYILTHPENMPAVQIRMEDILQGRSPTPPSM